MVGELQAVTRVKLEQASKVKSWTPTRVEEDLADQFFNFSEKRLARVLLLFGQITKESKPENPLKVSQATLAEMVDTPALPPALLALRNDPGHCSAVLMGREHCPNQTFVPARTRCGACHVSHLDQ
jgi:hypothetical protein